MSFDSGKIVQKTHLKAAATSYFFISTYTGSKKSDQSLSVGNSEQDDLKQRTGLTIPNTGLLT